MRLLSASIRLGFVAALVGLAGCEGLGEGNKIEKIEIVPANGSTQVHPYKLFECLRDQFVVIATFTDGTRVNFSSRARWKSSDPAVVRVSNRDIPFTFVSPDSAVAPTDFVFTTAGNYPAGVVEPVTPGMSASISAEVVGLRAKIDVTVRTPQKFMIAPSPHANPLSVLPADVTYLGTGTLQRFNLIALLDGRPVLGTTLNATALNPLLWKFVGAAEFAADDPADPTDFNRYLAPNATNPVASLSSGLVSGIAADLTPLEIQARFSLCENPVNTDLAPSARLQVADLDASDPITLAHEDDFVGDLVHGTNEQLKVTANLDVDGDDTPDQFQDISDQSVFGLTDSLGAVSVTYRNQGPSVFIIDTTNGDREGNVKACFPAFAPVAALADRAVTVAAGGTVALDASESWHPDPDATFVQYRFNPGDGSGLKLETTPVLMHTYEDEGQYTATVEVVDSCGRLSGNTGATRVIVGTPVAPTTLPTPALTLTPASGRAPLRVTLDASGSSGGSNRISVYSFDVYGDGSKIVHQSKSRLTWTYLDTLPADPSVTVTDRQGFESATAASATAPAVSGGPVVPKVQSNSLVLNAVSADLNLTTIEIIPPGPVSERAFTFPGTAFDAVGEFAVSGGSFLFNGTNPLGANKQKITRFVRWTARPAGVTDEVSDLVSLRNSTDFYKRSGHVSYLRNVTDPGGSEFVDITGVPGPLFNRNFVADPAPVTLEVTLCPDGAGDLDCPP